MQHRCAPLKLDAAQKLGDPEALIVKSTDHAAERWDFLRDALTSGDAETVKARLDALKGDPRISRALWEPAVLANLAGQIHVRLVEMHKRTHLLSAWRGVKLEDSTVAAFLQMPFEQAVTYWRERGGDPEILDEVIAAYREQAAENGDLMLDTIAQRAVDAITRTLESGGTLEDFKRAVQDGSSGDLVSPLSDDYLDLVFRTQVSGAYGAGRHAQLTDPDVIAARPYRQGRTSEDERVRDEHAPIDGVVWRADDPTFADVFAPFGFRCRCATVSGDEEDLASWGGVVSTSRPAGFVITPGFGAEAFH